MPLKAVAHRHHLLQRCKLLHHHQQTGEIKVSQGVAKETEQWSLNLSSIKILVSPCQHVAFGVDLFSWCVLHLPGAKLDTAATTAVRYINICLCTASCRW